MSFGRNIWYHIKYESIAANFQSFSIKYNVGCKFLVHRLYPGEKKFPFSKFFKSLLSIFFLSYLNNRFFSFSPLMCRFSYVRPPMHFQEKNFLIVLLFCKIHCLILLANNFTQNFLIYIYK